MTSLKLLSVGLALVAVTALTVGSAGFSSMSVDRSVSVNVVDDDEAYVGVEACNTSESSNVTEVTVRVTNRFSTSLTVVRIDGENVSTTVASGDRVNVSRTYDSPVDEVTVEAVSDGGTSVIVTREVVATENCTF